MQPTLTVFTPAYNRAHTIGRTYESLCRQTSRDFCWLIIDDGSTDGTRDLVASWLGIPPAERMEGGCMAGFHITYVWQKNQGMHGAHNTAYHNISTELNTCIDSDDWMPDNAVERIVTFWHEHGSEHYAGIIGLDQTEDGKVIGTPFPDGMNETTLLGFYEQGGNGDKKLVYRTDIITHYPEYPLFEGERYVGLAYKYMLIDQDWTLLTFNEPLVTVEYQQDGSSVNMYRQYWNNPRGFAFFRQIEMQCTKRFRRRFVVCMHYVSSCIIAHDWKGIFKSNKLLTTLLSLPFGVVLSLYIRQKVKSQAKMNFR